MEWSLRHQAHPNFIRWTICNGNRPRVVFARGLGVGGIVAGIITAVLIILSHAGRGWRVLSAIGLVIGIATLIAAWKGMCVVSPTGNGPDPSRSLIFPRFSMVCIIDISDRGNYSTRMTMLRPTTR